MNMQKKVRLGLADPNHKAKEEIDKASHIASKFISLSVAGNITITSGVANTHLVSAVDKALEKAPTDLDLLVAKSGALCCAMQFKSAGEVIDQVLSIDPEHFEARQRKDHLGRWPHLFQYPPWSEATTTLHPVMAAHIQQKHQIQIVRDGLQVGIAIVRPVSLQQFPKGLSSRMRSKWEPVWSDTLYGTIIAHYLLVEDDSSNPMKIEAFLPTFVPDEVTPLSGYWLLQRMSRIASCFLILVDSHKVLYNKRYVFSDKLKSTLLSISQRVVNKAASQDIEAFRNACQWHMQNFDLQCINF